MPQGNPIATRKGRWYRMIRTEARLEIAHDRTLTALDFRVLAMFECCSDDDNQLHRTLDELATDLGYSRQHVIKAMRRLTERGWICRRRPGVYQASDRLMVSVNDAKTFKRMVNS